MAQEPKAVVELVNCSCSVSKCSVRYSCKTHNVICSQLCKCEEVDGTWTNALQNEVHIKKVQFLFAKMFNIVR